MTKYFMQVIGYGLFAGQDNSERGSKWTEFYGEAVKFDSIAELNAMADKCYLTNMFHIVEAD